MHSSLHTFPVLYIASITVTKVMTMLAAGRQAAPCLMFLSMLCRDVARMREQQVSVAEGLYVSRGSISLRRQLSCPVLKA